MFNLPDTYRMDVKVALKDFIPKDVKPNDKKRIRDAVKSVKLEYQIAGEEIPSVLNKEYRCQVIQFYDIEVENIKDVNFLASTYQNLIKPFCVLHMHDTKDEVYSLAVKRLSLTDDMQIVIENSLVTQVFMLNVPDSSRERFLVYVDFIQTKNKQDKVSMYKEWFYKAYMLQNEKAYAKVDTVLESNFWYDSSRTAQIALKYMELVKQRESLKKAVTNAERMRINKSIKTAITSLDSEEL
ncbi:MAG: DUF4391 domain-containing protein [Roseburia sp.]|nr:DUF4391 domain-containing protein [Roseburia sp.]MCM1279276.1 DUF4391 domain-containing protein [Robinsoniella sp.]